MDSGDNRLFISAIGSRSQRVRPPLPAASPHDELSTSEASHPDTYGVEEETVPSHPRHTAPNSRYEPVPPSSSSSSSVSPAPPSLQPRTPSPTSQRPRSGSSGAESGSHPPHRHQRLYLIRQPRRRSWGRVDSPPNSSEAGGGLAAYSVKRRHHSWAPETLHHTGTTSGDWTETQARTRSLPRSASPTMYGFVDTASAPSHIPNAAGARGASRQPLTRPKVPPHTRLGLNATRQQAQLSPSRQPACGNAVRTRSVSASGASASATSHKQERGGRRGGDESTSTLHGACLSRRLQHRALAQLSPYCGTPVHVPRSPSAANSHSTRQRRGESTRDRGSAVPSPSYVRGSSSTTATVATTNTGSAGWIENGTTQRSSCATPLPFLQTVSASEWAEDEVAETAETADTWRPPFAEVLPLYSRESRDACNPSSSSRLLSVRVTSSRDRPQSVPACVHAPSPTSRPRQACRKGSHASSSVQKSEAAVPLDGRLHLRTSEPRVDPSNHSRSPTSAERSPRGTTLEDAEMPLTTSEMDALIPRLLAELEQCRDAECYLTTQHLQVQQELESIDAAVLSAKRGVSNAFRLLRTVEDEARRVAKLKREVALEEARRARLLKLVAEAEGQQQTQHRERIPPKAQRLPAGDLPHDLDGGSPAHKAAAPVAATEEGNGCALDSSRSPALRRLNAQLRRLETERGNLLALLSAKRQQLMAGPREPDRAAEREGETRATNADAGTRRAVAVTWAAAAAAGSSSPSGPHTQPRPRQPREDPTTRATRERLENRIMQCRRRLQELEVLTVDMVADTDAKRERAAELRAEVALRMEAEEHQRLLKAYQSAKPARRSEAEEQALGALSPIAKDCSPPSSPPPSPPTAESEKAVFITEGAI